MSLKQQLIDDMKTAMKAGQKERLLTIRLMISAIKQREVDERIELDDGAALSVLEKMVKQRKDSITQFEAANRDDLAAIEQAELVVIRGYLPEQLSTAEIDAAIAAAIAEANAGAGPQAIGKVMAVLKPKLAGKADMGVVSQRLKAALAG